MEWTTIPVSSITNAMRGKSQLEKHGFTVQIQRSHTMQDNNGCGYQLLVKGNALQARGILKQAGIRITGGEAKR